MTALAADRVILRDADPLDSCGREVADVVVDVVGGSQWPALLDVIKRGGPYAVAGAIAGPVVTLDLRTLYLTSGSSAAPSWSPTSSATCRAFLHTTGVGWSFHGSM